MVERWDLITIGNLSRNRYWGESDDRGYRPALCTSTLLRGAGFTLLVDPPFADGERMAAELSRRTGLRLQDVDTVFLTHEHGDHIVGVPHFPEARLLAPPPVAEALGQAKTLDREVEAVEGPLFDCLYTVPTPGHTLSHHSLRFTWRGQQVVVAADAAMTVDFWRHRQGYFNSVDFDAAARSIEHLAGFADVVIPGHDNVFLAAWAGS